MSHKIALNFEDGITRFIDGDESESIADAAYRHGINVPMDCRDGVCGTCKAFCQLGEFDPGSYIGDALSDQEATQGYILCCQAKAQSNMVIDIRASSGACKVKPSHTVAEVVGIETLSTHRVRLSVRALEGALPMFLPGQYANVTIPGGTVTRPYSFTSLPGAEVATFLIRNIQGGKMGDYIEKRASAGDRLLLNGPFGTFYLRAPRRPIFFLAGGTGIGPILAMLEQLAAQRADGYSVRLLYGVRHEPDLVEVDRINAFTTRLSKFSYSTCCSRPESKHSRAGYVTDHFSADALNGGDIDAYVCGPPEMVEGGRRRLTALGLSASNVYFEKFAAAQR